MAISIQICLKYATSGIRSKNRRKGGKGILKYEKIKDTDMFP